MNKSVIYLPKDDILSIDGFIRVDDYIMYPNEDNVIYSYILEIKDIQLYIIDQTIYGCFIQKDYPKYKVEWFTYYKNNDNSIIPSYFTNLETILDRCASDKIENLIYHIDILSGSSIK